MRKKNQVSGNTLWVLGCRNSPAEYGAGTIEAGCLGKTVLVLLCDIIFACAMKHNVELHCTGSRVFTCYMTLEELALRLPYNHFGQYLRSHIINMNHLRDYEGGAHNLRAVLSEGNRCWISPSCKQRFVEDATPFLRKGFKET